MRHWEQKAHFSLITDKMKSIHKKQKSLTLAVDVCSDSDDGSLVTSRRGQALHHKILVASLSGDGFVLFFLVCVC